MRKSRYAVEAEGPNGEFLLYNVANGAFAQLDEAARGVWEGCADLGSGSGSAPGSGAAAAELVRLGMLTDLAPEGELARQRDAFDATRADTSALTLSFVPTYACNFRCPYCYELGHNKIQGKMDERTMGAILDFVEFKHAEDGFGKLSVQWYGGDPSLALAEVEQLTGRLLAWCEATGVEYDAMMLTNANVIDAEAADVIARCRIASVLLTIDGPEEIHNKRRVPANGTNSYERTIEAARLLRERGIALAANMNADKVNLPHYAELRERLLREEGIELSMGRLTDYGHFFGEAPFCAPEFDLFTHEEFVEAQFDEFARRPHTAAELRELLNPVRRFCTGQLDNYFVIDLLGDVYNCDGWVGDREHVRFNLFDDRSTWKLHEVSFDATRDEKCSACELLPVCQGNCIWERRLSGMPCHPLKQTIGGYLRIYREAVKEPIATAGGVAILAEPQVVVGMRRQDTPSDASASAQPGTTGALKGVPTGATLQEATADILAALEDPATTIVFALVAGGCTVDAARAVIEDARRLRAPGVFLLAQPGRGEVALDAVRTARRTRNMMVQAVEFDYAEAADTLEAVRELSDSALDTWTSALVIDPATGERTLVPRGA